MTSLRAVRTKVSVRLSRHIYPTTSPMISCRRRLPHSPLAKVSKRLCEASGRGKPRQLSVLSLRQDDAHRSIVLHHIHRAVNHLFLQGDNASALDVLRCNDIQFSTHLDTISGTRLYRKLIRCKASFTDGDVPRTACRCEVVIGGTLRHPSFQRALLLEAVPVSCHPWRFSQLPSYRAASKITSEVARSTGARFPAIPRTAESKFSDSVRKTR